MDAKSMRVVADKPWLVYLLVGLAMTGGYYLIPARGIGSTLRVAVYCSISLSGALALWVGIRRHRPQPRTPWLMLAIGQIIYACADTKFYIAHYVLNSQDYPSSADLLYLIHYPVMVIALLLLIRARTPGRDLPGLLDAAVVAVAVAMFYWLYLIAPQARADSPLLAKLVSLTYPPMDLLVLIFGLKLMLGVGRRPASFVFLSVSLTAIFTADTFYTLQQIHITYHPGNYLDVIWLTGNLTLGAAGLHPTMTQLSERSPVRDPGLGLSRMALIGIAALAAPAMIFVQYFNGAVKDVPILAGACVALYLLTTTRMWGLVKHGHRLAYTDPLTGLATRRLIEMRLLLEITEAHRRRTTFGFLVIDIDRFKTINDRFGHPAGDRALTEIAARLRQATRPDDLLARYGGEEFALVLPGASPDELWGVCERVRRAVSHSPVVIAPDIAVAITVSVGAACFPDHGADPSRLIAVADRALYTAKACGRDRAVICQREAATTRRPDSVIADPAKIEYLVRVADQVDAQLSSYEHSRAVSRWAMLLAARLGHDETTIRRAELAGRLHDVGKIIIGDAVLGKADRLNTQEWTLLRAHPDHGAKMIQTVPELAPVATIVRQHHERFDGTGYPARLAGSGITIEARIIAVCDSWAAIHADRRHQDTLSEEQARRELQLGYGTQFDPDVVDLFLDLHDQGLIDSLAPIVDQETTSAKVFQNMSS